MIKYVSFIHLGSYFLNEENNRAKKLNRSSVASRGQSNANNLINYVGVGLGTIEPAEQLSYQIKHNYPCCQAW